MSRLVLIVSSNQNNLNVSREYRYLWKGSCFFHKSMNISWPQVSKESFWSPFLSPIGDYHLDGTSPNSTQTQMGKLVEQTSLETDWNKQT